MKLQFLQTSGEIKLFSSYFYGSARKTKAILIKTETKLEDL
jgi:hypothetical protein